MDDHTIEALREVLQDMTATIELLLSGDRSGAALIRFIEEMLKTIESWAAKYNVVLHDGSVASITTQGSHPENNPPHVFPIPRHPSEEVMGTPLDIAESLARHHAIQECRVSPDQVNAAYNPTSAGNVVEHTQINDADRVRWHADYPGIDHSLGNTSSIERNKRLVQASSIHISDMPRNICSPESEEGLNSDEAGLIQDTFETKRNKMDSSNWLPEGWITEMNPEDTDDNVGSKNKVFVDPTSSHRFHSKKEVLAFLGRTKQKRVRTRKTEFSNKFLSGQPDDTAQAAINYDPVESSNPEVESFSDPLLSSDSPSEIPAAVSPGVDTAKRKRGRPRKVDFLKSLSQTDLSVDHVNASVQACDIPESVVGANMEAQASSGNAVQVHTGVSSMSSSMNNLPLPHQSGQPSEWQVYESLASLSFPMFEHLRFMENNANKSVTNSNTNTLWPWTLSNPEGLKKPSTNVKLNEKEAIEESKQGEAVPASLVEESQVSLAVPKRPKKAARKIAS